VDSTYATPKAGTLVRVTSQGTFCTADSFDKLTRRTRFDGRAPHNPPHPGESIPSAAPDDELEARGGHGEVPRHSAAAWGDNTISWPPADYSVTGGMVPA